MNSLHTIKSKIVLMLMASVVLVLVLIAIVSTHLVTELYQRTAEEKLAQSKALLQTTLEQRKSELKESGQRLTSEPTLLASTHLVWKYQDKGNYQPLIFDVEKKSLLNLIEREVRAGGYTFAGLYSQEEGWYVFYDAAKNVKLYSSYDVDRKKLLRQANRENAKYVLPITPVKTDVEKPAIYYRLSDDNKSLVLVSSEPVISPNSEANEPMAWLYTGYRFGEDFINDIAAKTAGEINIYAEIDKLDKSYLLAASNNVDSDKDAELSAKSMARLMSASSQHYRQGHYMHGSHHFSLMYPLQIEGSDDVAIAISIEKGVLTESLEAFQDAIFLVLLLSGVAVVPMGLYFAGRYIIHPVQKLTETAHSLAKGETPMITGFSSMDELGVLANAFNKMTEAIQFREESLRSKQREIEGIIDNAPSVISMKSPDGRYLMVNELFLNLFDLAKDRVIDHLDEELFAENTASEFRRNDKKVIKEKRAIQFEESIMQTDKLHTYISNKFPLLDDHGEVVAVCSIATDITERKNAELKLTLAKNIIEHASEAVVVTDLNAIIEDVNQAYTEISGFSREEIIGQSPSMLQSGHHNRKFYEAMWKSIHETGHWEGEVWDRRKNGEIYPKYLSISTVNDDDGKPYKYVGIFSDITERMEAEKQLRYLAYYDALTELPNRVMFYDRLKQALSMAKRDSSLLAVMMVDLDRFKYVNDTLGHDAGDELLIHVSQQLKQLVRDSDTVARIGGDEFKVILSDIKNSDEASIVAEKIINKLKQPVRIKGRTVNIGTSIGIAIYPDDGADIEQLIKCADLALYKAKDSGRNGYQYYSDDLQTKIIDHIEMEADMRKAMSRGEFLLEYQPKINLHDGSLAGMESLVRWHHPEKGLIPPDEFIPFAEETGLIIPLGEWILKTACTQLRIWTEEYGEQLRLAINLSTIQFRQSSLLDTIKNIIDECGVKPEQIELEITESMVMRDVDAAIVLMKQLREIGLKLAIDDFGTGYSSLNYLKRFPINTLKIDKSFIRELTVDSMDAAMVRAIISMTRDLGIDVVAEGVETREQANFLAAHDCQYVQGFYYSRPLKTEAFVNFMADHREQNRLSADAGA